jgi:hypothetical protein
MDQNQSGRLRADIVSGADDLDLDERYPSFKLDLAFFTLSDYCPAMVRAGSRKSFELFLFLAYRYLAAFREPVSPSYDEMCVACGLDPASRNSRSTLSHVLRKLRDRYRVIAYDRVRRRRPEIRVIRPDAAAEKAEPRHYVYWDETWNAKSRRRFESLGSRAFAAQYMYVIAQYEADLAHLKHRRAYWFFPLERLSSTFHVSPRFAQTGLGALVELGALHVTPGQFHREAPNGEFGRANRYYFEGLAGVDRRRLQLRELRAECGDVFQLALPLADALINGRTVKNVRGLCDLLTKHGLPDVQQAVQQVSALSTRSLKRRLPYVRSLLANR